MLRLTLIGGLQIEVDGEDRTPPRVDRPAALLAWLALTPGTHARGSVAARFWPDVLDSSALASLRSATWSLRRLLGPQAAVLAATRDRIGLDGESLWVDVREVDGLIAAGRDDEALALADGELLPGAEGDWVDEPRERHRTLVMDLLGRLVVRAAQDGDVLRAADLARRRAALDPLSEELHRDLFRRLAAAGDRGAALAAYADLRRRLLTTLGVGPSEATRALVEDLSVEHPSPDGSFPHRLRRVERSPFVGRASEVELLRTVWQRAHEGVRPQLALVVGEPGIGKTRLAARVAAEVAEAGGTVLYGGAAEGVAAPLEPFLEALQGGQALALDELSLADDEPAEKVRALFSLVEQSLAGHASSGPVLLVLDDLHWADRATMLLLGYVMRSPVGDRLLVLALFREREIAGSPLAEGLAALRRECDVERVELAGLEPQEVEELVGADEDTSGAVPHAALIARRTGGNPYFVRELARDVAASGSTHLDFVPAAIRDLVNARVARLGEGTVDALTAAAVLGERFPVPVLESMLGAASGEVGDALDAAIAAGFIHELGAGRFSFVHTLDREAIYMRVGPARRAALHRRAANAIAEVRGRETWPAAAEIALHLCSAGDDPSAAIDAASAAAEDAIDRGAYGLAVLLLTRALALVPEEDRAQRKQLSVRRAVAHQHEFHVYVDARQLSG
jgi:DNA-binding SARP family transcriptional activator